MLHALSALLLLGGSAYAQAVTHHIDAARSTVTIYAYKTGVFSFAAHDHEISAPVASGEVDEGPAGRVNIRFDARTLKVLDPKLSAGDRADVQQTMLGSKVLDAG